MPNREGLKLVEREDGIEAMERFQFHENEDLRNMANGLVDRYFGEDYGVDEQADGVIVTKVQSSRTGNDIVGLISFVQYEL